MAASRWPPRRCRLGVSDELQLPPVAPPESPDPKILQAVRDFGLEGRRLYLPQMPYGGSYLFAASIRSIGLDAQVTTNSDERTLELGGRMTSGDECYPQKITMGDFLRMIDDLGRDKVAFLMPTANGPCRFGQYMQLIRAKFDELGYEDMPDHHHHLERRLFVDRRSTPWTSSAPRGAPSSVRTS